MKTYHDLAGSDGGSAIVAQVTEHAARLAARMASVRHVVAVMSGKGGVGKSSVTVNLAGALALGGAAVGVMDADVNGASLAKMTGVIGQPLQAGATGVRPAEAALGLHVMSIDLFLADAGRPVLWDAPTQHDAFTWRGMMEAAAVREMLADTEWGALDVLLIDLPPGADKLPTVVDLWPQLSGALVVSIPSAVAQHVVGKSIHMAREVLKTPVLGLVENMAAYVCPHCGEEDELFPGSAVEALAAQHGVPYLGRIPFDPRLAAAADAGVPFMQAHATTPTGHAIQHLADQVQKALMHE